MTVGAPCGIKVLQGLQGWQLHNKTTNEKCDHKIRSWMGVVDGRINLPVSIAMAASNMVASQPKRLTDCCKWKYQSEMNVPHPCHEG